MFASQAMMWCQFLCLAYVTGDHATSIVENVGMFLFGTLKLNGSLNDDANFQTFYRSFLTLIRLSTGEEWQSVMHDSARASSSTFTCQGGFGYDEYAANGYETYGCGTLVAYPYHISFQLVVTFIFLNLFIAIILEGFDNSNRAELMKVNASSVRAFMDVWNSIDDKGDGYFIKVDQMPQLIR